MTIGRSTRTGCEFGLPTKTSSKQFDISVADSGVPAKQQQAVTLTARAFWRCLGLSIKAHATQRIAGVLVLGENKRSRKEIKLSCELGTRARFAFHSAIRAAHQSDRCDRYRGIRSSVARVPVALCRTDRPSGRRCGPWVATGSVEPVRLKLGCAAAVVAAVRVLRLILGLRPIAAAGFAAFVDRRVPRHLKLIAFAAIVLVLSPLDLLGDIPLLGAIDDAGLLSLVLMWFTRASTPYVNTIDV